MQGNENEKYFLKENFVKKEFSVTYAHEFGLVHISYDINVIYNLELPSKRIVSFMQKDLFGVCFWVRKVEDGTDVSHCSREERQRIQIALVKPKVLDGAPCNRQRSCGLHHTQAVKELIKLSKESLSYVL